MTPRYVLSLQAAEDLFEIWEYVKEQADAAIADRVEKAILERITFLSAAPGLGHRRHDITSEDVKFFSVYSYLIAYRPETRPLEVVSILHGRRDVERILKGRL